MDRRGLQLASRFSFAPNSLGYCGRDSASQRFIQCINDHNCQGVDTELTKFIALYPYLKTISQITSQPLFSHTVIECYWLGNDLLNTFKPTDYSILLKAFKLQGIPEWLVAELSTKQPREFIPNHLFQVLHVGVGKASGAVPFSLESINNCMIRWGTIEDISPEQVTVTLNSLKLSGKSYTLIETEKRFTNKSPLVKNIRIGDPVAVHWNMIVKKLTQREAKNLEYWTQRICSTVT